MPVITILPDNTNVEEPVCSPYEPVKYLSLKDPVGAEPVPLVNCMAPAGPDAIPLPPELPVSEQFIYAQPNFAMGYPTPEEPDQLVPASVAVRGAEIEVRPATTSTSVEPESHIADTFNSKTPLSPIAPLASTSAFGTVK